MSKNRMEAFSDGVIAIIITILVLELKIPHGGTLNDLVPLIPVFLSYVLSFIYLGIYWNNHHHILQTVTKTNGKILWANLHLLFWLSLLPFVTGWMGENHFEPMPVALYGIVLLLAAIAYFILQTQILKFEGKDSLLAKALGKDTKGKMSPLLYAVAIACSFYNVWLAFGIYIFVALMWLIPDKRIEKKLQNEN
ncbi:MAG TPA: TMEM175 family protein [Ignavibacteria bacterium]|nr:TMEM175 family protein [Ignavibacteria bacterium]HQY51576.1 TMEM175 family protein [Ignavibacteria bacterium]HRB00699.1 TMEM175 family protein [Ignavibacteria bacterium]